ncbi:hypothetical protein SAMD00024442_31_4 [Candidatus Symbiothrix dinenymphae]|nr:hypothetical protein SAMD00024442_31_4 [Candidatus Symbiothrix dinenymphae]
MKKKKTVIAGLTRNPLLIVAVLFMADCTELIDIRTDNSPPVIVIYGELTNELKHQEVNVSRSSPYFADEPNEGISGAVVKVNAFSFTENDTVPGLYLSDIAFAADTLVTYSLSVEVEGKTYTAKTEILRPIMPDSLTFQTMTMMGVGTHILSIHFQDTPQENYYLLHTIYKDSAQDYKDTLLTAKLSRYSISDNERLFKGQYQHKMVRNFADFSTRENEVNMGDGDEQSRRIYLKSGDSLEVTLSLIPKGFYDFIRQCKNEKDGENPMFGGPASNIETNISNGGVGYFAGYYSAGTAIKFTGAK